jgi:hypothetical protein
MRFARKHWHTMGATASVVYVAAAAYGPIVVHLVALVFE